MKRLLALAFALLVPVMGWAQSNGNMPSGALPSYAGMWWNAPAGSEAGWGISIAHQGDILFAVWYTYDRDGTPMWLVMPDAALFDDAEMASMDMMGMMGMGMMGVPPIYTGKLYRSTGPAFSSAAFDRNAVGVTEVGEASFVFASNNTGVFRYYMGNVSGRKNITRMVFSSMPTCAVGLPKANNGAVNYQDLWWRPAEAGWGVNIAHQGNILFATWYTYDAAGKGMWLVMSNAARTGDDTFAGKMYRATGPSFDSASWDVSKVRLAEVGFATFTFGDESHGTFAYTLDGVTQSKAIQRMVYALPASVCN